MGGNMLLKLAAGGLAAGIAMYLIATGKLDAKDGKFLGLVEDSAEFGLDDFAKGLFVIGFAAAAGAVAHNLVPSIPAAVKV